MDVEGASECGENSSNHEPHAAAPGANAERANGSSRRDGQPAEGRDERALQEAEESLEAIRHE
jgi:hypothetical protein